MAARVRSKKPSAAMVSRVKARNRANAKAKSTASAKARKTAAAKKRREAALDDPAALTRPLTPRLLDEQVSAASNLYAGGAEAEIAGQRNVHNAMSAAIPSWYQNYVNARTAAMQQTGAAYQAAVGFQQNAANTGSALDAQQRATLMQQQQADAATRGATVDPSIAAMGQQAAASRRAGLDAQIGLTAGLGATNTAYRAGQTAVATGQGLKAMEAEAARGRGISAEATRVAREKGQFATKHRQELIDREHTKQLENKAFGLNAAKAEIDARQGAKSLTLREQADKRKARNERDRIAVSKGQLEVSQGQLSVAQQRADAYDKKLRSQGKPKMSTQQRNLSISTRDDLEYTLRKIKQLRGAKVPVLDKDGKKVLNSDGSVKTKPAKLTWGQIRSRLETGQGIGKAIPHDLVNAALDLDQLGYLSPANIRALHKRGVSIGAMGYRTKRTRRKIKARAETGNILANTKVK